MKLYNLDGTFQDHPEDTKFGWYLEDIAIDESLPGTEEHNLRIKEISRYQVERLIQKSKETSLESSLEDCLDPLDEDIEVSIPSAPKITQRYPQIIETIDGKMVTSSVEGSTTQNFELSQRLEVGLKLKLCQLDNFRVPSKEEIMNLINPVNIEARALLSVVSSSKYLSLTDKDTSEEVLKSINFRTTNSKHLIHEQVTTEKFINEPNLLPSLETVHPKFNLLVNGESIDTDKELYSEIQNYHATKEDNMLSLMMELIITDLDSNAGDMTEVNHSVNGLSNADACVETSDLGNSPQSSVSSKEGEEYNLNGKDKNYLKPTLRYLEPARRSDILHSIGLSDDIDKSIQSFREEKSEMRLQLIDIKESFQQDEDKVTKLINEAIALEKDLRETAYLDNVVHLLKGNPEKVVNSKWPFCMFRKLNGKMEVFEKDDDNFIV